MLKFDFTANWRIAHRFAQSITSYMYVCIIALYEVRILFKSLHFLSGFISYFKLFFASKHPISCGFRFLYIRYIHFTSYGIRVSTALQPTNTNRNNFSIFHIVLKLLLLLYWCLSEISFQHTPTKFPICIRPLFIVLAFHFNAV